MKEWIRKFMYGRYGIDELSVFLVILSLIIMIIGRIFSQTVYVTVLGDMFILLYLYRIFSRNITQRQKENYKFIQIKNRILFKFRKNKSNVIELKSFKIIKCPKCGQKLRVPRKKGRIIITCSKCRNEFKAKS